MDFFMMCCFKSFVCHSQLIKSSYYGDLQGCMRRTWMCPTPRVFASCLGQYMVDFRFHTTFIWCRTSRLHYAIMCVDDCLISCAMV